MTWARLDDGFARHPKIAVLSDAAFRLHTTALCYCNAELTDGFIAAAIPATLPCAPRGKNLKAAIDELTRTQPGQRAPAWEPCDGGGYRIHDFLDRNPSRAQVLADRAERQQAKRRAGIASAASRRTRYGTAQPARMQPDHAEHAPSTARTDGRTDARTAAEQTLEQTAEQAPNSRRTPFPFP